MRRQQNLTKKKLQHLKIIKISVTAVKDTNGYKQEGSWIIKATINAVPSDETIQMPLQEMGLEVLNVASDDVRR